MVRTKNLCRLMPMIAFLWLGVTGISNAQENLDISLTANVEGSGSFEKVICEFTVQNNTNEPMVFLKRNTPFEGFCSDFLQIMDVNGKRAKYIGKLVDRDPPTEDEYTWLQPGQILSTKFDLDSGYTFSNPGNYSVSFSDDNFIWKNRSGHKMKGLGKHKRSNWFYRQKINKEFTPQEPDYGGCSNCSSSDGNTVQSAWQNATSISKAAWLALENCPAEDQNTAGRYITWFGAYDAGRYNTVRNNFSKIYSILRDQNIQFQRDDSKPSNTNAYVYASKPYTIYICPGFWNKSAIGPNSEATQASIIAHEVSHFSSVAGTTDHCYGSYDDKQLALSSPSKAVVNADCYELFANNFPVENLPFNTYYHSEKLISGNSASGVKPLQVAQYELTYRNYYSVMNTVPKSFPVSNIDLPVTNITWFDAILFCNEKSKQTGVAPAYSWTSVTYDANRNCTSINDLQCNMNSPGYRLPKLNEWQNAYLAGASATSNNGYYWTTGSVGDYAWYKSNSGNLSHNVGGKIPNNYGLYDIAGNVYEWVWDDVPNNTTMSYNCGGGWNSDQPNLTYSTPNTYGAKSGKSTLVGIRPVRTNNNLTPILQLLLD